MNRSEIKISIDDIKVIISNYMRKEGRSELLLGRLNQAEKKLLDDFYEAMNKPVVKKPRAKKQQAKTSPTSNTIST